MAHLESASERNLMENLNWLFHEIQQHHVVVWCVLFVALLIYYVRRTKQLTAHHQSTSIPIVPVEQRQHNTSAVKHHESIRMARLRQQEKLDEAAELATEKRRKQAQQKRRTKLGFQPSKQVKVPSGRWHVNPFGPV